MVRTDGRPSRGGGLPVSGERSPACSPTGNHRLETLKRSEAARSYRAPPAAPADSSRDTRGGGGAGAHGAGGGAAPAGGQQPASGTLDFGTSFQPPQAVPSARAAHMLTLSGAREHEPWREVLGSPCPLVLSRLRSREGTQGIPGAASRGTTGIFTLGVAHHPRAGDSHTQS